MATQREDRSFPEGFLWGTATAAHQIEGGNWNSDWWEFENKKDITNNILQNAEIEQVDEEKKQKNVFCDLSKDI